MEQIQEQNNELKSAMSKAKDWLNITGIRLLSHAVDIGIPQMNTLVKEVGEEKVEAFIASQIFSFLRFINVKNSMADEQVFETSQLILTEYWHLRPTEIRIFFNNCKLGKYGKIYDRIDGMIIFEFLKSFILERDEVISNIRLKENSEHKKGNNVLETLRDMKLFNSDDIKRVNKILDIPLINKTDGLGSRLKNHLGTDEEKQINHERI